MDNIKSTEPQKTPQKKSGKQQKKPNIVGTILVGILVVIAVLMVIFTVVSIHTKDAGQRGLFGFKAFVVLTDSMSATDFDAGDLIICKEVKDPSTLQEGDIITFQSLNSSSYGEVLTHKIRRAAVDEDGNPGYITYGTTTDADDETVAVYSMILGKYLFNIPKLGNFLAFLKTPVGYLFCIFIPFMLLIAYEGWNCMKAYTKYKKAQKRAMAKERKRLIEERKEAQRLRQELQELRDQMKNNPPQE